jgi:hypothetical protein
MGRLEKCVFEMEEIYEEWGREARKAISWYWLSLNFSTP